MIIRIEKNQARFKRVRAKNAQDTGAGAFFFLIGITAEKETLYLPLSIASGKKPTGFVYHIEGTAEGTIATTDISVSGAGVTQVTLGTIVYAKIPAGKTALFRILIETRGVIGKEYAVGINRIQYKHQPSDARYVKLAQDIRSKRVKFS